MEKIQEAQEIEKKVKEIVGQDCLNIKCQSLILFYFFIKIWKWVNILKLSFIMKICYRQIQMKFNQLQKKPNVYFCFFKQFILRNLNKGQEALANYEKVLQINQNHIEATYGKSTLCFNLALTLLKMGTIFMKASRACDILINHDSNNLKFQLSKAMCLMNLYKIEEALDLFEIILNIDENNMMALNGRGRCL